METKWYQKPTTIIAFLILFFPAGLFLMWKYTTWHKGVKILITSLFVLMILGGALSDKKAKNNTTTSPTPQQMETVKQYAFDVPSLVGKDLDSLTQILGEPKGIDPTDQQIELGTKEWDKTFIKNDEELLVTYTITDEKVIDFFIVSTDNDTDKEKFLKWSNLSDTDPRYRIEFVKMLKDPSRFTGVRVIPL